MNSSCGASHLSHLKRYVPLESPVAVDRTNSGDSRADKFLRCATNTLEVLDNLAPDSDRFFQSVISDYC